MTVAFTVFNAYVLRRVMRMLGAIVRFPTVSLVDVVAFAPGSRQ